MNSNESACRHWPSTYPWQWQQSGSELLVLSLTNGIASTRWIKDWLCMAVMQKKGLFCVLQHSPAMAIVKTSAGLSCLLSLAAVHGRVAAKARLELCLGQQVHPQHLQAHPTRLHSFTVSRYAFEVYINV